MKYLVNISFAMELDEDDLVDLVRRLDQSIYENIAGKLAGGLPEGVTWDEVDELLEWYGASFTPRRTLEEFSP